MTYGHLHREFLKNGEGLQELSADFHFVPAEGILAGTHNGAHFYTIGQRKGLNIGGKAEPMFVIATDTVKNNLYVGMGHDHPGLNRWGLFIPSADIHWIRTDRMMSAGESKPMQVRVRYRQPLQEAELHMKAEGLYILFGKKQRGITSGQFAAWYEGEELGRGYSDLGWW